MSRFDEVVENYNKIAEKLGIGESTARFGVLVRNLVFVVLQAALHAFHGLCEHANGRGTVPNDMLAVAEILGILIETQVGINLFVHQDQLKDILAWCGRLYQQPAEQRLTKMHAPIFDALQANVVRAAKVMYSLPQLGTFFLVGAALAIKLFASHPIPVVPLYSENGFIQESPWYELILIFQTGFAFVFLRLFMFNLTTYWVFTKHISGQLDYISAVLESVTGRSVALSAKEKSNLINYAIELHTNALVALKKTSVLFKTPMLLTEMAAVSAIGMAGIVALFDRTQAPIALVCIALLALAFIFSHLGQELSEKAEYISTAVYMSHWYELDLECQRKILLIMATSQRKKGISVGGFHLMCYSQYLQVSSSSVLF